MGGRGSSSFSGKGSPIGSAKPIEVENCRSKSSFGRSKQTILSATANGSVLEVGYSKPTGYEHPNRNTTVEKHTLKAGFYNEMGSREICPYNVDLSKATVVRGETSAIKGMLKEEGFRWDSGSMEWRRWAMGGRGASSGTSSAGKKYRSQYRALLTAGNVKYVAKNSKSSETLMETMRSGRVYVVVDRNEPRSIVYFDEGNKRRKQIDLNDHHGLSPHAHHGYLHNENSPNGKPTRLTTQERKMVDKVLADWRKYKSGQ